MQQLPYQNYCLIFDTVSRPVNSTYKTNLFNKFLTFLTNFSVNVNVAVDMSTNSNTIVCLKTPFGKDSSYCDQSVDLHC